MSKSLKIFYYSIILFSFLNGLCKSEDEITFSESLKEEDIIDEITIRYLISFEDVYLGPEGYFYLETDFYDNITKIFDSSDIEENTAFNSSLRYSGNNYYKADCHLWITFNRKIMIFCKTENPSSFSTWTYVSFIPTLLNYKSYKIYIEQPTSTNYNFYLYKRNPNIPFLYSNEQIIDIEEGKNEYELKFKYKEYNNEFLLLNFNQTYKYLENCYKSQNNIICPIKTEEIEEILHYNNQKYLLSFYHDTFGLNIFDLVENIYISFNNIPQKQNLYIGITKLLSQYMNNNNYAAYETNVTSISNIISGKFVLNNGNNYLVCHLKKSIINPLLLLCKPENYNSKNYNLKIDEEIELNNSNIKYNFLIQPVSINDYFIVYSTGNEGIFVYPRLLDFSKSDRITIYYLMNSYSNNPSIKLNPDSNPLEFISGSNIQNKSYTVQRKHFENKKSGYYYSYYMAGNYNLIFYELPPIQVIIPNDYKLFLNILKQGNPYQIQIGGNGIFILITNYNDNETNILDKFEIEKKSFNTYIYDTSNRYYEINCKFWKPNIGNIRLICTLNNKLINAGSYRFYETYISYNRYTIDIYSSDYLEFRRQESDFPFLYSEPQVININEQKNSYNLKFNIGSYNNELLIMVGKLTNNLILDNCQSSDTLLNCQITKEKLEEMLITSGEQFTIGAINDKEGIISLINVLPITIKYENIIKQVIQVKIDEIIQNQRENPLVLKTNINNIQNLHSNMFNVESYISCFFKKTKINPLFLFCIIQSSSSIYNYTLDHEVILKDIHYKYNFVIQPFSIKTTIYMLETSSFVFLAFPDELNFKSQNSMSIIFIIPDPSRISSIYLTSENSYQSNSLSCDNLIGMKRCNISLSYFLTQNNKEVDYYSVEYYSSYTYSRKIDYSVAPVKVTLPTNILNINIRSYDNSDTKLICKNGAFYFISSYDDTYTNIFDASNIEEKTLFKTTITQAYYYNQIYFNLTCHLWKPKNKKIVIICQINDNLDILNDISFYAYLNETILDYNGYKVVIYSNNQFYFKITSNFCPFLYADDININLRETDQSYELNFKIKTYNDEPLLLATDDIHYISLENCTRDWNNLVCKIEQSKIIEQYNNQAFKLYYISQIYGFQEFGLTPEVYITSSLTRKETINVQILRLLQNSIGYNNYIAYSTNTSNISNIVTGYFLLQTNKPIYCFLKKNELDPLLMLCRWPSTGNFSLGEIKQQIVLDNINIRYNFRILPIINNEVFRINYMGSMAFYVYPQVLNFYLNDSITFYIRMNFPEYTNYLSIDNYNSRLSCEDNTTSSMPFKKCIVNKNYFLSGTNRFSYLYHLEEMSLSMSRFYELSPVQIKMPKFNEIILRIKKEDNMNMTQIGKNGVLSFITNYYNESNQILNDMNIESLSQFSTKIIDEYKNEYNVDCRLWNPKTATIRIICKLNQNLKYEKQNIILKDISFEILGYIIYIYSDTYIEVKQLNHEISFLYAANQNIMIDYYQSSYKLNFKIESYNNDLLYIYDQRNNYLILDDCSENDKELICTIRTEKLNGIIAISSTFSIGAMNDNIGVYELNNIFTITFSYYKIGRTTLYVTLRNPFGFYTEIGLPFGYETNVTNIENLITEKYGNCYFKKITAKPLLYLCTFDDSRKYTYSSNYNTYINNMHWKYDFVIRPYYSSDTFTISGTSSIIRAVHPDYLDFSNKDSFVIRYLMSKPALTKNIKFILTSSNLECQDLNEMKKCKVSFTHFRNQKSDNYFTYYLNSSDVFSIYNGLSPLRVTIPVVNLLELSIDDSNNQNTLYLGSTPILYFVSNFRDTSNIFDLSDSSELNFNTTFSSNKNNKIINGECYFWKPMDGRIRFICRLNDIFENDEQIIYLNDHSINYMEFKVIFYTNAENIKAKQLKSKISFLYSDRQQIYIDTFIDSYKLRFKKEIYNQEQLILYSNNFKKINLECNTENSEVICNIKKDKLTQILSYSGEVYHISQLVNSEGIIPIDSILDITIYCFNAPKTKIGVEITKLLTSVVELNNFIVYETNITNIPVITTNYFNIISNRNAIRNCLFKKNSEKENDKLLLLCLASTPGTTYLGLIEEIPIDDASVIYNFTIAETIKYDVITVTYDENAIISSVSPLEINFNDQDSFTIRYETQYPERLLGIKLNKDSSSELECKNKMGVKECNVTQSHFTESGDYYTYHDSSLGDLLISYEIPTIKVTLKEGEEEEESEKSLVGIIVGSVIGGLAFIAIVVVVVLILKKKWAKNEINGNNNSDEKEKPLNNQDQVELKENLE